MKKVLTKIEKEIENMFCQEGSGHDIYHLKRVLNLALQIQEKEGGDKLVVAVASLLHDIHRIIGEKKGKFCSPKDSLPYIKKILDKVEISEAKKNRILHCIEYHEEYDFSEKGKTKNDLETLILQDADNLDAMGAIGIARTFVYCGKNNIPIWNPEIIVRENFDESENDASSIDHFHNKLLKLKDNMNTKTGRKLAVSKHKFMKIFLKEFLKEWGKTN